MSDYLRETGIPHDIAVGPGVWVIAAPGASILENVATGDLIGYCGSVQAFQDRNPALTGGETCW
jgi:hypothetical protein